jgi:phage tail tape-measure protein
LREEDVALLVKAAYDDASDAARAAFMARVQPMPTTAWPWSAVQAKGAGNGSAVVAGRGGRGDDGPYVERPRPSSRPRCC